MQQIRILIRCTITNLIQNELAVRVEWKSINAIEANVRTYVLQIPGNSNQSIGFSGYIVEKGDISSVIEAKEPGADSSMAFASIQIQAINSDDGDSFEEVLDLVKEDFPLREAIAVGVALLLALGLVLNAKRNARKKREERRQHVQQRFANTFVMNEGKTGKITSKLEPNWLRIGCPRSDYDADMVKWLSPEVSNLMSWVRFPLSAL